MRDDDRKNATIKLSMTQIEREALIGLAKRSGVSVSELVRLTLVYQTIDLPPAPMGQVAKLNDKDKRSRRIQVQVTPDEKRSLRLRADSLGCSVSDLVRRSAIEGKVVKQNEINIEEVRRVYHELMKQGTNLNQLMYFLNANGIGGFDRKEVEQTLHRVRKTARDAEEVLSAIKSSL